MPAASFAASGLDGEDSERRAMGSVLGRDRPAFRSGLKFYFFAFAELFVEIRQAVKRFTNCPATVDLLIVQKANHGLRRPRNPVRLLPLPAAYILNVSVQKIGQVLLGKIDLVA